MKKIYKMLWLLALLAVMPVANVVAENVAKIGSTEYGTLAAAVSAAQAGDEIVLLSDVTLDGVDEDRNAFPAGMGLKKSLTINGNNHTLTPVSGKRALYLEGEGIEVTLKNLNIVGNGGTSGPVWVFNAKSLTLDNTSIDGSNYSGGYNQPLTINSPSVLELNILNGSEIKTNDNSTAHYAVIAWTQINAHVQNSSIKGWAVFYLKAEGGNMTTGASNSKIDIDNSTLTSSNIYNGASNAFSMFAVEAQNVTINVTNSQINVNSNSDQYQAITSFSDKSNSVILGEGNEVTLDGEKAIYAFSTVQSPEISLEVQPGTTSNVAIPEYVCADGYIPTANGDGTYGVKEGAFVAQIGDVKYETLAEAIAAATDGQTVTLLADVTLTDRLFVNAGANPAYAGSGNRYAKTTENKSITLDMNGHNITSISNIALAGGSLNITNNGTADATHGVISTSNAGLAPIEVRGTGDLTQKRTLTVGTGVTLTGSEYGLNVFGSNDAQKNIIDVNVNGRVNGTLFVLGNLKNAENEININVNGTIYVPDNGDNSAEVGIALNGNATVTVNEGANVSGETGIEVRAGELIVNGGTIKALASTYSYTANGDGSATKGAAIAVAQHTTVLPITTTLNGGTLEGGKTLVVEDAQNNGLNSVAVTATESYTQNAQVPEGYTWKNNGNGKFYLEAMYVAQIGTTKYASLAEAVAAATDGQTVTLLADVTLTDRLFVNAGATPTGNRYATTTENKSITLDMNGHNITSSSNIALAGGTLNITGTGTIKTTTAGLAPIEIRGTGDLTQKRTLTVGTGVTLTGSTYGLNVFGSNDAQKNIIDVNVNGTVNGTLFVLGNLKNAENEININVTGTIYVPDNGDDDAEVGIALNGNAAVTVNNGAKVSGETGIEVRAGKLVVNGGTITATASTYSYTANGDGSATKGAAIAVAQHTTKLPIATTLNGGTLTGGEKTLVVEDAQNNDLSSVEVTATESFTENAVIPEGFKWEATGENTYTLVEDIIVLTDGIAYTNDEDITEAKVAYKRTFGADRANVFQAWMVPFDYKLTATDVANFDFYEINTIEYAEQDNTTKMQIRLSSAKAAGDELEANMPYIYMPKSAVGEYTFKAEVVTLTAADGATVRKNFGVASGVSVDFYSVYQNTKPTDENFIYYMSKAGKVGYSRLSTTGFAGVGPFRWIFKVSGTNAPSTAFTFGFAADEDDDVTAVSSAAAEAEGEVVGYYTLNGQKVSEPTKGVYVVKYANGTSKKVVF